MKFHHEHDLKDKAIIWAYHKSSEYTVVRWFDHFMNLALLFGFFKVNGFIFDSIRLFITRTFRSLFQPRKRMFHKYAKP